MAKYLVRDGNQALLLMLQTFHCQSKLPPPLVQQQPHIACKIHSYIDLYFESLMKTGERKDH